MEHKKYYLTEDQPPNKLAEGVPPHTSHYACDERVALYGDKTIGCCCTGHMCEPKDQPVDVEMKRRLQILKDERGDFVLTTITDVYTLLDFIQAECNRARLEERWKQHDAEFNYEPNEACPYCMGEAHSLKHEAITDRIAELQQLMKEGE